MYSRIKLAFIGEGEGGGIYLFLLLISYLPRTRNRFFFGAILFNDMPPFFLRLSLQPCGGGRGYVFLLQKNCKQTICRSSSNNLVLAEHLFPDVMLKPANRVRSKFRAGYDATRCYSALQYSQLSKIKGTVPREYVGIF
jgi:hypothetical protein